MWEKTAAMTREQLSATCKYHLQELPPWQKMPEDQWPELADRLDQPVWWSGVSEPPKIGDRVNVVMNGFGPGVVVAYFTEHGYLGVEVKVDKQPEWHRKQNGAGRCPMVFGSGISGRG